VADVTPSAAELLSAKALRETALLGGMPAMEQKRPAKRRTRQLTGTYKE